MNIKGTTKPPSKREGKSFLNVEIDPILRDDLHIAARAEGKNLKEWLPEFLRRHVPSVRTVTQ